MRFCGRFTCNPCAWKDGAVRQISFDAIIPLFTIPILTVIASQNLTCTVLTFVMLPPLVYYLHRNFLRFLMRTKFFLMWTITSVLMLMLVFELIVVPLLEILPEENFVFVFCVVGGLACGYKTRLNSDQATQEGALLHGLELGEGSGDVCNICRRRAPPKAFHCKLCQTCILGREYHCKWYQQFTMVPWVLIFSAVAFIYGSNLTMTSVCHPFILVGTILLPDDCSDVYYQLDIAICFVSAVYSLLIGLVVLFYLIYHLWLLHLGTTTNERRLLSNQSQHNEEGITKSTFLFCCRS